MRCAVLRRLGGTHRSTVRGDPTVGREKRPGSHLRVATDDGAFRYALRTVHRGASRAPLACAARLCASEPTQASMAATQDETAPAPIDLHAPLLPATGAPVNVGGGRWVGNPLVTIRPVYENVYVANLEGAALVAERWNGGGAVRVDILNLCPDAEGVLPEQSRYHYLPLNDVQMVQGDPRMVCKWMGKVATRIEAARIRPGCEAVVVCCRAGIERSNVALLGWLVGIHHGGLSTTASFRDKAVSAYLALHSAKADSARYYGVRARFAKPGADGAGAYSWPTLSSRSREWGSNMVAHACLGIETFKEAAGIKELSAPSPLSARSKRKAEVLG